MSCFPALPAPLQGVRSVKQFHKRRTELEKRRDDGRQPEATRKECTFMAFLIGRHILSTAMTTKEGRTKESQSFLGQVLDILEKEKATVTEIEPSKETRDAACEDMVLKVFSKADDIDRSGMFYDTNLNGWVNKCKMLARQFLIASQFFEVIRAECYETNSDSEFPGDLEEKLKYSKVKTHDILNALNQGLTPTAGGFESESKDSQEFDDVVVESKSESASGFDSTSSGSSDIPIGKPPKLPTPKTIQQVVHTEQDTKQVPQDPKPAVVVSNSDYQAAIKGVTMSRHIEASTIADTIELAKFAIAALNVQSLEEAEKYLIAAVHAVRKANDKK